MAEGPTAYFILRREDGFGDVHPLVPGSRYTIGRASDNRIILKDDLCSRHHAEIFADRAEWVMKDLGSLNGLAINERQLKGDATLHAGDVIRFGRANYLFVRSLEELPPVPEPLRTADTTEGIEITKRLGRTKYLATDAPGEATLAAPVPGESTARPGTVEALGLLFRLAMEMAEAETQKELADLVISTLLRATSAEVGAILLVREGSKDLEPLAYDTVPGIRSGYHRVSQFVSREVLTDKQAVLAEDIAQHVRLKNRESVADLRAGSLICAPILHDGKALGLLHLYRIAKLDPLNSEDLELTLAASQQLGTAWHRLLIQTGLATENRVLKDQLRVESEIVGDSLGIKQIEDQIHRVAATKATVLIRGESGVGKELVARAIHAQSPRKAAPIVCLNCAALTETLLESELFGHEKGAFTGATERMIGKFESADRGTIFLDEIGEMGLSVQAKLLRVLEGHPFERVGGNVPIKVDVRVVAATNRSLEEGIRDQTFRKDLYFRLQVVQLDVPPLRDRPDDILKLAQHFLKRFSRELGRKVQGITPAAAAKLLAHNWPGNVRELKNVIERATALGNAPWIDVADVWLSPLSLDSTEDQEPTFRPQSLEAIEKVSILATLNHTDWNKSKAAEILGIERSTLDRKIKAYDLRKSPA